MGCDVAEKTEVKMVRVVATARGYDNVAVREQGEVFQMPEGSKGTWFQPYKGKVGMGKIDASIAEPEEVTDE